MENDARKLVLPREQKHIYAFSGQNNIQLAKKTRSTAIVAARKTIEHSLNPWPGIRGHIQRINCPNKAKIE